MFTSSEDGGERLGEKVTVEHGTEANALGLADGIENLLRTQSAQGSE